MLVGLGFSLTWDNPFVWFMVAEYVGVILGALYWVYNTRLRMGYKASFYVPYVSGSGGVGDFALNEVGKPVDVVKGVYSYVVDGLGNVVDVERLDVRSDVKLWKWIGDKDFKPTDKIISFKGKTFQVNLKRLSFRKFGFEYLNFNFEDESVINFGGEYFTGGDAETVDDVMGGGLFRGLFKLGSQFSKMQYVLILLGLVAGVAVGALVVVAVYQGYVIPNMFEGWSPNV